MTVAIAAAQIIEPQRIGRHIETRTRLTLTSTYVTGGVPIAPSQVGLGSIQSLDARPAGSDVAGLVAKWDQTNSKILLFETAAAVDNPLKEITSAQSVSTTILDVTAKGLG
jgi:hypothetical protein